MRTTMTIRPTAEKPPFPERTGGMLQVRSRFCAMPRDWIVTLVAMSLIATTALAAGLLVHPNYNDENFYNRLIRYYGGLTPLTPLYDAANHPISIGPTFFLAHRAWSGIFGAGDFQARAFSLALMLVASAFWVSIAQRLYREATTAQVAAFWLMPFHAVFATCTLAEPFMLACLLASVRLWIAGLDHANSTSKRGEIALFCASGILLGLALNSKTPLLTTAIALFVMGAFRSKTPWSALSPLIAILFQLPFWLSWGNVFPPGQRQGMMPQFAHLSGLFPDTTIHMLTVCGTVLWPAVRFDRFSRRDWFVLVIGLVVWFALGPRIDPADETRYRFAGPLLQASYFGTLVRWGLVLPFLAGWKILCDSIRHLLRNEIDPLRQAFLAASVLSVVSFARSPLAFDRYVVCFLPLWWLAFWPELKRSPVALGMSFVPLAAQALILCEKATNPAVVFDSPLPYLAGF